MKTLCVKREAQWQVHQHMLQGADQPEGDQQIQASTRRVRLRRTWLYVPAWVSWAGETAPCSSSRWQMRILRTLLCCDSSARYSKKQVILPSLHAGRPAEQQAASPPRGDPQTLLCTYCQV